MRKSCASVLALLLGGAVCAESGSVAALTCGGNSVTSPQSGATNVPTNTLLWGHGSTSTTRLLGPGGDVAIEEHSFPAGAEGMTLRQSVFRPVAELEPDTRYTLVVDDDAEDENPPERVTFVTGSGPATTPPAQPELLSVVRRAGPTSVGPSPGRWLELDFAPHDDVLLGAVEDLGDVSAEDDRLGDDASSDEPEDAVATPVVVWIAGTRVFAGTGQCMVWPSGGSMRHSARFGIVDIAGNFSGWSSEIVLELPDQAEAERLAAEAEAAERARREDIAELQRSKPRMGLFEGHNTGCALSVANRRAPVGSLLAAFAILLARRRLARNSHPPTR